jgi:hypothetical protein
MALESNTRKMVLVAYAAGRVRLIIRIYFYIISLGVTYFGGKSQSKAARLDFIKNGKVPVVQTLGWKENYSLAKAVWSLKTLPGGWRTFLLMAIASILSLSGDFAVTTFVVSINVPSR